MEWIKYIVLLGISVFMIWIVYQFIMTICAFKMWKKQQEIFKEEFKKIKEDI